MLPQITPNINIRILIADAHLIVHQGIRHEIASQLDMEVIGETTDGYDALEFAKEQKPQVIILDAKLDRLSGIKLTRCLQEYKWVPAKFKPKVLVYSSHFDKHYVWSMFAAGAKGYVLKSDPPEKLLTAIRQVNAGKTVLSQQVQTNMVKTIPHLKQELSVGETKVMQLLAHGHSNQEIAQMLDISVGTVKAHINNTYRKIPWIRSRAEAVAWAWINHIVSDSE